jgi:hypothetical protein
MRKKDAMQTTVEPTLRPLDRLVGEWTTEATHPARPGVIVRGTTSIAWLEGQRFLMLRSCTDHPDFPDAISIVGFMDVDRVGPHGQPAASGARLSMHYYDERGVFRALEVSVDAEAWRVWREAPGFSQRFTGRFADGGATVVGQWQLRRDDMHWEDDLRITYRRQATQPDA